MTSQPDASATGPTPLPPDPERFDEYRNVAARRRGMPQPYIAGGDDPDLGSTLAAERPYVRILLAMIALIVMLGFVLGIVSSIITGG
ncbi:MAG TPA: hypothetical protein VKB30_07105 [Candidatus Limnocylindrales bacterium]|nr:hypothetical protein [Candidatus Limnocylindrales bacterium]